MANYQAGFNAKARIGAAGSVATNVYAIQRYTVADEVQEQDVSNTEGLAGNPTGTGAIGNSSYIAGLRRFTASLINATFDVLQNPFQAPLTIFASNYVSIRLFLNSSTGVSWTSNSFLVTRASQDMDVRGLQPITITGVGDGSYTIPST